MRTTRTVADATGEGLSFFSLTTYGLAGIAAGIVLMTGAGRMLLPRARRGSVREGSGRRGGPGARCRGSGRGVAR